MRSLDATITVSDSPQPRLSSTANVCAKKSTPIMFVWPRNVELVSCLSATLKKVCDELESTRSDLSPEPDAAWALVADSGDMATAIRSLTLHSSCSVCCPERMPDVVLCVKALFHRSSPGQHPSTSTTTTTTTPKNQTVVGLTVPYKEKMLWDMCKGPDVSRFVQQEANSLPIEKNTWASSSDT